MEKHKILTKWKGGMAFETELGNHIVRVDGPSESGGEDSAPGPKRLMLVALTGCTGMDVVSILKKMRVELDNLEIEIEADHTEEYPKHYVKMNVVYKFYGKNLPIEKLQKAVQMSEDTYCGVRAVYAKAMEMTSEIRVIESDAR
ncbi:MAG: osmotically inducible protein C [Bacteroidales bacterium 36-12]|nr:MAG: osmotically inducible protein C [Bacteroidales bacterium 36-12]